MKSYCIEQQKRCQIITESTLNKLDEDGKSFVIYNLATAIYTKSGGTPWKIRDMDAAPPGTIFVGIAFTIDHQKKEINAGSLYFYDRLGKYLSFELTRYILPTTKGLHIPYKNMKELLEKLRGKFNWARYLIFHKTTPYHTEEVKAVSESLGKDINYALIYLKAKHPMRFFKNDVNNFCNTRGEYITLKNAYEKSFVIYTTGNWYDGVKLRERPESFGTPKPIEVMVVENNIKKLGIEEIAKQIILLTKLDWNTCAIGVKEPITTKYSRKAASLLPMFKDTQKYSIDDIRDLI
ncbi:MAG: Piwi domain-containing protein [Thermoproteota archaeon]